MMDHIFVYFTLKYYTSLLKMRPKKRKKSNGLHDFPFVTSKVLELGSCFLTNRASLHYAFIRTNQSYIPFPDMLNLTVFTTDNHLR